jgi:hypothetical protein
MRMMILYRRSQLPIRIHSARNASLVRDALAELGSGMTGQSPLPQMCYLYAVWTLDRQSFQN